MKRSMDETYESIYRTCFPKLVAYLQQHTHSLQDAEDIASRAMLILWNKWSALPTHTQKGLLCWLISTARNLAKEDAKKGAREPVVISLKDLPLQMHPEAPLEPSLQQKEEAYRECLQKLIDQLPKHEAELLLDKIERRLSDEEIAARLGITINAVRVRWTRTKSRIAVLMQVQDADSEKGNT